MAIAEAGVLPIGGENLDGCVCIYREEGMDGRCVNKGHPVCEKNHPGLRRTFFVVRKVPAHA